jgi:pimeloyl-ACP methyl ester carboxylesterase
MAPNVVKSGYVLNDGSPLNYLEWVDAKSPTVVLLHGVRGYAYMWRQVAERLATRYTCIALSVRGHGDSGPVAAADYTYDGYVTDVHALAEQLGLDRFTIVGHSMGGRTAIAYAAAHPERTQAIVVVDHAPAMPEETAWAIKRSMEATPTDFSSWEEAVEYAKRNRRLSADIVEERAFYAFRKLPDGRVTWKHDPVILDEWRGDDLPPRGRADLWDRMDGVRCPMLVVKGESTNQLTPELCDRMASYGPSSRWVEIPNTGHGVYDDNLEGFLAEVEKFLAQVTAAAIR